MKKTLIVRIAVIALAVLMVVGVIASSVYYAFI